MSISTVSRALNDKPDASDATRDRVRKAASDLGYFANHSGRSLRSGVTGSVGFVVQTSHVATGQGDTFFMAVFDGMQTVLSRHQLDLIALLCPSTDDPADYVRRIVSRGFVDGLVISHTRKIDPRIPFLASRDVPFVALGRSDTDAGHAWIDLDFEAMAQRTIDRFVAQGHRRIAVALQRDVNFSRIFLASARRAMEAHGLTLRPEHVFHASASEAGGYGLARKLVESTERPTAIAIASEAMMAGIYRGLLESDYLPGRDIALIGRDSSTTQFLSPRLTSFHANLHDLGVALGEALLALMPAYRDQYPLGVVRRLFATRFIQGESDRYSPRP